ncbi:Lipopolysaccharide core galacturonosyltransferase RgtC [Tepidimonas sediminis]|uniref:Lipopolysaccharide core galacturonosyltransferase RgtC n=1 Tax=Tepidimonas sediminis TaxID=2588941 RepID=A0A554WV66_9BURK|nr:hypothetical protein [Tepidimonas sediminis]TSE27465.1 Lipopolysaccharide core galacturonosyltransferase RgtC [Tepidimonas sediminis]
MNLPMRRFALGLAVPYVAWAILRLALMPALEFDEAEQVLHRQWLRPLYGPQPPLFEWLVWGLGATLGLSALEAVVLLKAVALWTIGMAAASFVRQAGLSVHAAGAAGWWVLSVPLLLWDAPRSLTHSLMATAWLALLAASSAPLFVRARQPLGVARWALLGVLAAAALLSKYNAVLALAGWAAAVLTAWWRATGGGRDWARLIALHARQALPAWLPAVTLLAWHVMGVLEAWPAVRDPIAAKMRPGGELGVVQGVFSVVSGWLATLSLPALLLGLARRRSAAQIGRTAPQAYPQAEPRSEPSWLALAAVYASVVGSAMLVLVVAGLMVDIKERWILPLAVPLLMLAAPGWARFGSDFARRVRRMASALVALALALLVGRGQVLAWMEEPSWSRLPARAAAQWVDGLGPDGALVVAAPIHLAGALAAYGRRDRPVLHRHASPLLWGHEPVCALLIVQEGTQTPGEGRLTALGFIQDGEPRRVDLPRVPAAGDAVTLQARAWRHPDPRCPARASVYDHLP